MAIGASSDERSGGAPMNLTGWVILAVGAVLCFYGARSLHVAVLTSGFALGWLLADAFNATALTSLVFGLFAGIAAWVLTRLVFGIAMFVVGALAGAVVGAKLFALLQQGEGSYVLAVLFVAASAFIGGVVTRRFHTTMIAAICALGGAGLMLSGLAQALPQVFGALRAPQTAGGALVAAIVWIALAVAGWVVQRRSPAARAS